jgi:chromate reductase, NAD(P)H dehydrogenase (quinone)
LSYNIVALSGSLRKDSFTTAVLRAAVTLGPSDLSISIVDLVRELPLYDEDLADAGAGDAMRSQIAAADGVLIATPEYNYNIPGPLKNWLDWASRPFGAHCLMGKSVACFGVSPGGRGGKASVEYLRTVVPALGAKLAGEELLIPSVKDHLDEATGTLSHEVAASLSALLVALRTSVVGD